MSNSATSNAPDQKTAGGELTTPATGDGGSDIDDMLASFSTPPKSPITDIGNDKRKASRYKVKWKAVVVSSEKGTVQGFLNDISTQGASIYLNASLPLVNCTIHIQVPPLEIASKPYVITATGKVAYSVYDGNKHLFRTAINFLRFQQASDLSYLEERLNKHHVKIPELTRY